MANIISRAGHDQQPAGDGMDFVPSAVLEDRLKKARHEQLPEGALPAGLVLLLPHAQPWRAGMDFGRHATAPVGQQQGSLLPNSDVFRKSASKQIQVMADAIKKPPRLSGEAPTAMDNNPGGSTLPPAAASRHGADASAERLAPVAGDDRSDEAQMGGIAPRQQENAAAMALPLGWSAPKIELPVAVKAENSPPAFHQKHAGNEVPDAPAKLTPGGEGQNRISYAFTSWGSEHRVLLTATRDISQQLSVVMKPSDSLVSRRLQEAIAINSPGAGVVLREEAAGEGQQQRRHAAEQMPEEDE